MIFLHRILPEIAEKSFDLSMILLDYRLRQRQGYNKSGNMSLNRMLPIELGATTLVSTAPAT